MKHREDAVDRAPTGSRKVPSKLVNCRFGRYVVTLRLTLANKLVEVVRIAVRKDFLSDEQKRGSQGYHDVTDLYEKK